MYWHSGFLRSVSQCRTARTHTRTAERHHLLFFSSLHLKLYSTVGSRIPTAVDSEVTEDMAWRLWI